MGYTMLEQRFMESVPTHLGRVVTALESICVEIKAQNRLLADIKEKLNK